MARYGLFVLNLLLNTNRLINLLCPPALCDVFRTPMARYGLFVLNLLLNTNRLINLLFGDYVLWVNWIPIGLSKKNLRDWWCEIFAGQKLFAVPVIQPTVTEHW